MAGVAPAGETVEDIWRVKTLSGSHLSGLRRAVASITFTRMRILALDTSTAAGSAGLAEDGRVIIARAGDGSRTHGERLPLELMTLLDDARLSLADIDRFAVAIGPGSFTGLRVGIATIQGLTLAKNALV